MKKVIICFLSLIFAIFCLSINTVNVRAKAYNLDEELKISSKSAILVDYETEKIIYEKNSNERLPIASMTKLASLSVVFDFLDKGIIKPTDLVTVSDHAAGIGGSSAFLDAGSKYQVCDLVKSVIIASANDSMVALAEFVSGTEETFVSKLNKKMIDMGLNDTQFQNVTGLPAENHYSSASDLVKIYKTVCNKELFKKYSKIWMDTLVHPSGRKTGLTNTNRLIKTYDGIEGGKTGFTNSARFCLTASACRGNTRLIGVVIGADDSKTRFAEMSKLFNFGFANYETKLVINSEVPVTITTFKNAKINSSVVPEKNISLLVQKNTDFEYSTDYELFDLKLPINKGSVVGKMFVFDKNNMVVDEVNLIVTDDINPTGVKESLKKIINLW